MIFHLWCRIYVYHSISHSVTSYSHGGRKHVASVFFIIHVHLLFEVYWFTGKNDIATVEINSKVSRQSIYVYLLQYEDLTDRIVGGWGRDALPGREGGENNARLFSS